jgi:hypothetical protein
MTAACVDVLQQHVSIYCVMTQYIVASTHIQTAACVYVLTAACVYVMTAACVFVSRYMKAACVYIQTHAAGMYPLCILL